MRYTDLKPPASGRSARERWCFCAGKRSSICQADRQDLSAAVPVQQRMAVLMLASWAAEQGGGLAVDEITGQVTGIGDFRRALVQAGAAGIGVLIALALSTVDYRSLVKIWPVHVIFTWGLVLPTLVIHNLDLGPLTIGYNAGDTDNYSWYRLGGFTFQPTELAKISFILTFAMHLNNVRSRINEPKELAKLLLHLMAPIPAHPHPGRRRHRHHLRHHRLLHDVHGGAELEIYHRGPGRRHHGGIGGLHVPQRQHRQELPVVPHSGRDRPQERDGLGPQRGRMEEHRLPAGPGRSGPGLGQDLWQRDVQRGLLQRAQRPQRLHFQLGGQRPGFCGVHGGAGGADRPGDPHFCGGRPQRGSAGQLHLRGRRGRAAGPDRRQRGK